MKIMRFAFYIVLTFMLVSCGNSNNKSSGAITNISGGNVTGTSGTGGESSAITINPIVITENTLDSTAVTMNGSELTLNLDKGTLLSGNEIIQITETLNGSWQISSDVSVSVTDNNGKWINGKASADVSGNLLFVPDLPLTAGEAYRITISKGGSQFTVAILIPVDNISKENSLFANVYVNSTSITQGIRDIYLKEESKAIFGWEFLTPSKPGTYPYSIQLTNVETGAYVYLTFYGVYDIEGYEDEIFYQRWYAGEGILGEKVENYKWSVSGGSTFAISFDETDYSIPNQTGGYYSFKKTYAEIRIIKEGVDITSISNAKLIALKK